MGALSLSPSLSPSLSHCCSSAKAQSVHLNCVPDDYLRTSLIFQFLLGVVVLGSCWRSLLLELKWNALA